MKKNKSHINIFIAYAREDNEYLEDMRIEMKQIRDKAINVWYDGLILPGEKWNKAIKKKLHNSDIVVLLISRYSLASEYFYNIEMTEALERHDKEDTIVVPIILTPCSWQNTPLSALQLLPSNATPISKWEHGKEDAWYEIGRGIEKTITNVQLRLEEKKRLDKAEKKRKEEEKRHQENTVTISKVEFSKLTKIAEEFNKVSLTKEEINEASELLKKTKPAEVFNEGSLGEEEINEVSERDKRSKNIITIPKIIPYLLFYSFSVFLTLLITISPI